MTPKESTTARPWFICPSWAAVVPLLVHAIATAPDSDEAAAAAAELQTLARGLDQWNARAPRIRDRIAGALERTDENEPGMARVLLRDALKTLEGEQ